MSPSVLRDKMVRTTLQKQVSLDDTMKGSKQRRKSLVDILPKSSPRMSGKNSSVRDATANQSEGKEAYVQSVTVPHLEAGYSVPGEEAKCGEQTRRHLVRKVSVFQIELPYKSELLSSRRRKISPQDTNLKSNPRKRDDGEDSEGRLSGERSQTASSPLKTRRLSLNHRSQSNLQLEKPRRVTVAEYAPSLPKIRNEDPSSRDLARSDSDSSISSIGSGSFWLKRLWREMISRGQESAIPSESSRPKPFGLLKRMRQSVMNEDDLRAAIVDEDVSLVARILEQSSVAVDKLRAPGITLLHEACAIGSVPIISLLLERGADINLRTWTGLSPVMVATVCGHFEAAELLLSKGANQECVRNGFQLENRMQDAR